MDAVRLVCASSDTTHMLCLAPQVSHHSARRSAVSQQPQVRSFVAIWDTAASQSKRVLLRLVCHAGRCLGVAGCPKSVCLLPHRVPAQQAKGDEASAAAADTKTIFHRIRRVLNLRMGLIAGIVFIGDLHSGYLLSLFPRHLATYLPLTSWESGAILAGGQRCPFCARVPSTAGDARAGTVSYRTLR